MCSLRHLDVPDPVLRLLVVIGLLPAAPSHVSFFRVTGFVAEQETLHFTLCFQKRQGPHVLTCIGKLWLAACSARVWEAPTSKVSTTLLGATFAVAADPGLLPLPSSEDCVESSPDEEAELLAEPSASDTAAFAVAAGSGLLPRPSSSLSPAAEAAELLAEMSDSDAAATEAALGEGLAASLDDIAAGPRRGASGARRSSPKEGHGGG